MSEAKKVKLDIPEVNAPVEAVNGHSQEKNGISNKEPSRVVHIRNVPPETNEGEVMALGLSFGRTTNCLLLRGKGQAFLEFADVPSAQQMVNYSQNQTMTPLMVRGRPVFCQFSNHKELQTKAKEIDVNNGASPRNSPALNHSMEHTSSGPCPVLRVIIDNHVYPVTLDILYQIFSRLGKVTKIVTFSKNGSFQALVQYENAHQAQLAKQQLDGQNIYPQNCCTLRIEFSKLQNLNVKYNNDKSRDFTNPSLPPGTPTGTPNAASLTAHGVVPAMGVNHHHMGMNMGPHPGGTAGGVAHSPSHHPHGGGGAGTGVDPILDPLTLAAGLPGLGFGSGPAGSSPLAAISALSGRGAAMPFSMAAQSPVLLVSNLAEQMANPEALFTLFGVYGDVMRVKILFNKKDNALIQMAEPAQAALAMSYLDKVKLYGKQIRVMQSKHSLVQLPKEGQDAGLTKDFSTSPLHRFKKPGSKNYANIYPPSNTLHLSNIPPSTTDEEIKKHFEEQTQSKVMNFKFFPKDHKMALIQFGTVEDAVHALIKMHNYQLSDSNHLRVSFSKSSI